MCVSAFFACMCMNVCGGVCVWENPGKGWDISGSELEQKLGGEKHNEVAGVYSVRVSGRLGWGMRGARDSGELSAAWSKGLAESALHARWMAMLTGG